MIKVILIDVDNTLLDFDECVKAALRDGFAHFGLPTYQEEMFPIFTKINNRLWHQIELGLLNREELMKIRFDQIFEALEIDFDGVRFEEYFRQYLFDSAIHVDGAMDVLRYLSGKYVVCAASNGPYEQQIHRLKKAGMYPYLTYCFISEQVGAEKPNCEFFEHCMAVLRGGQDMKNADESGGGSTGTAAGETAGTVAGEPGGKAAECHGTSLLDLRPGEVMMIGDSLTADMGGGIAYGMQTCWYDRDGKMPPEGMKVDYVVDALEKIRDIL